MKKGCCMASLVSQQLVSLQMLKIFQIFEGILSRRNSKVSPSLFLRNIAKCHSIFNLVGLKDSIEQNKSSSLEIKCRIARIDQK